MKRFALFFLLACGTSSLHAQVADSHFVWGSWTLQWRIAERWKINSDLQLRSRELKSWFQQGLRTSAAYAFAPGWQLSAGGAYFRHFGETGFRQEWRPWQEVSWKTSARKFNFGFRFRSEQRFMEQAPECNAYANTWRFRLRGDLQWFAKEEAKWFIAAGEECMYALPGGNFRFDQNRVYAGPGRKIGKGRDVQLHYMLLARPGERQHILRVAFLQQIGSG